MPFPFDNQYAQLPDAFSAPVNPSPVKAPQWIAFNRELASFLGLDVEALDSDEGLEIFAGNRVPSGAAPLAMAYAGHQFGNFVPQLGDGRALLLGEVIDREGTRRDIQLKGSGPTPFSRRGDGRSALGPVLREYLVSEGMAALGIPTTRALAAVWTGEAVMREEVEPGGVFTRVARSHLRIGTVQYFAARGEVDHLRALVDHAIERHDPEAVDAPNRALALLEGVSRRQADLIARWMGVGFIHGVMNTDNMSLSGETIDFGPCAFLEAYDPAKRFSYIDRQGRYAFANQAAIGQWNLARLAEALVPLITEGEKGDQEKAIEKAGAILEAFAVQFEENRQAVFARKLGSAQADETTANLVTDLLELMQAHQVDFTLAFRHLASEAENGNEAKEGTPFRSLFPEPGIVASWLSAWRDQLQQEGEGIAPAVDRMRAANPVIIPRNHRVEEVIQAGKQGNFAPFERMQEALAAPYEDRPEFAEFEQPARAGEAVEVTYCGT